MEEYQRVSLLPLPSLLLRQVLDRLYFDTIGISNLFLWTKPDLSSNSEPSCDLLPFDSD